MAPDTLEFKVACFFERNILKKTALEKPWRNFLRSWGLRPCRWGNPPRDNDAFPVHGCVGFLFTGNTGVSQCVPACGGQGWQKGDHVSRKRISPVN